MSEPHERLDRAMAARGLVLKKRWTQIAGAAGISTAALGAIRRGEYKPSPHTARGLDDALEWEQGSVEAILAGGEPTAAPEKPAGPDRPTVPPEVVELLDQRLAEVTERIAAREVRIVEALRKALGDEATEKLLAEEATDEPNGEDRRHAG